MKKIICVVWMMFALIVAGCSQIQDKFPEDSFYSALGVKFEYVDDDGYIFVNRANGYPMIMFFPNVSRNIEKTDEAFEGDWIYRLTYNWNGYCVGCEETIVLVNESGVSIDGVKYVPNEDANENYMDRLLEELDMMYEYFDAYKVSD